MLGDHVLCLNGYPHGICDSHRLHTYMKYRIVKSDSKACYNRKALTVTQETRFAAFLWHYRDFQAALAINSCFRGVARRVL